MTTIIKTENHKQMGEYKNTSVDITKAKSNRLVSICGNIHTIITLTGETLFLKKRDFNVWIKTNNYITDF